MNCVADMKASRTPRRDAGCAKSRQATILGPGLDSRAGLLPKLLKIAHTPAGTLTLNIADSDSGYSPGGGETAALTRTNYIAVTSGSVVTTSRVITSAYDGLVRLTGADYSTGESFAHDYDKAGNREFMTSTTPLSGTVVTTYTFDAANRLTEQVVSDGRSYTYPVQSALDCAPGQCETSCWRNGPRATTCAPSRTTRAAG